jgi:phenylpyruvate tautomerase PptA (4-oxalocrotonate tautomerase family)
MKLRSVPSAGRFTAGLTLLKNNDYTEDIMTNSMTVVTVEMWENFSVDQKRQLAQDITNAFVKQGVAADNVNIIMRENARSCWAVSGKLCSDFKIPEGA